MTEPPVYRPFALLAVAAALTGGIPLGVWMLAWLYLGAAAVPVQWIQLHAHLQIFGFFGTLIMGDGHARFELAVAPSHMNPHAVVHGGVVSTLVDHAMGGAVTSALGPGERCATLEIKIHYPAPVSAGRLAAEALIVTRTARVAVVEARAHADGGRLVALATGSFYIQSPR